VPDSLEPPPTQGSNTNHCPGSLSGAAGRGGALVAAIWSLLILAGAERVPSAARRRASAASLRAWVWVIHWPTAAGPAPESSAARYWASY
jgi:hypothetical protein